MEQVIQETQKYKVRGNVERIIYRNEENGYTVLEMSADGNPVTVVGTFPSIAVGETMEACGVYVTHPKYGPQLKAQTYEHMLPSTADAIESYLSSGVIKGIGPVVAHRIVKKFGDDTLRVLEETPELLAKVDGISPRKAEKISNEYRALAGVRSVMEFLQGYGISPMESLRIWKKFGLFAKEQVLANPYVLCDDEIGITFEQVDEIALRHDIKPDCYERLSAAITHVLRHNLGNGHDCLPEEKLKAAAAQLTDADTYHVADALGDMIENNTAVRLTVEGRNFIYIPRYYEAECYIASKLSLMRENEQGLTLPDAQAYVEECQTALGIVYAELQRKAITTAITSPVMILTGGPGTGKTTAISAIIRLLGKMGEKVALAAPTGRAAKRMSELCGVESKTIHRLLEVDFANGSTGLRFKRGERNPLPCDAVIIDETSMVDTLLFESLLRSLRFSCRLILVGDPDQLPSVGAGEILRDLIESDTVPVVHLSEIFRQAAKSLIITNAHAIVTGEYPQLSVRDNDFFFLPENDGAATARTVADLCVRRLPKAYQFSPMWDIQVITPTRVGALGTMELNKVLQATLNPPGEKKKEFKLGNVTFREGDKVMQVRNNYDLIWTKESGEEGMGVFNGDIGVIDLINRPSSSMLVRYEDRNVEYAFDTASELELAYAVTVHKSQGNEFEAVILPIPESKGRLYYRNLLYTAVTRAKRLLVVIGSEGTVKYMVDNHKKTRRYTNLEYLLKEVK